MSSPGCDQFDFLGQRDHPTRDFLERVNTLTYQVQRMIVGEQTPSRVPMPRPKSVRGSGRTAPTNPQTTDYVARRANSSASDIG